MQRQFSSGSRQAPDPFDQYLEENNYYRKHTARDASCLFRVICEQMYDTQLNHYSIRKKCVNFMRKQRVYYQPMIDRDLDEYLDDMTKPKTFGTLLELQAIGHLFKRNILLFQPFDLGTFYVHNDKYCEQFLVFYTHERHFDSVFECDYIKDAAICQSIVYEILYKNVFKLADVSFAVEKMLHGLTMEWNDYKMEWRNGYCIKITFNDGRVFDFDSPWTTKCILEDCRLCSFHHPKKMMLHDDDVKMNMPAQTIYLLPDRFVSCVRQLLLDADITPFPYKVAKALDPDMYRNIEFDTWNEARKELRLLNWYHGDANFKVPLNTLVPLPSDQFRPWALPYRYQRFLEKSNTANMRRYNYYFKMREQLNEQHNYYADAYIPYICTEFDYDYALDAKHHQQQQYITGPHISNYFLKQLTHIENFQAQTIEYCTMPLTIESSKTMENIVTQQQQTVPNSNALDNATILDANNSAGVVGGGDSRAPSRASVTNEIQQDAVGMTTLEDAETQLITYDASSQQQQQQQSQQQELLDNNDIGCMSNADDYPQTTGYVYGVPMYANMQPINDDYYAAPQSSAFAVASYDGSMQQTTAPPTTYVATQNGGATYYYLQANPAFSSAGNMSGYMPASAANMPQQPIIYSAIAPPQPAAAGASVVAQMPGYFTHAAPPYSNGAAIYNANGHIASTPSTYMSTATSSAVIAADNGFNSQMNQNSMHMRHHSNGNTRNHANSYNERINFDSKRSVKHNGADLPKDVATLRYFYNLGIECFQTNHNQQHKYQRYQTPESSLLVDSKEHINLLTAELASSTLDENANNVQKSKIDSNNNLPAAVAGNANMPVASAINMPHNQQQQQQQLQQPQMQAFHKPTNMSSNRRFAGNSNGARGRGGSGHFPAQSRNNQYNPRSHYNSSYRGGGGGGNSMLASQNTRFPAGGRNYFLSPPGPSQYMSNQNNTISNNDNGGAGDMLQTQNGQSVTTTPISFGTVDYAADGGGANVLASACSNGSTTDVPVVIQQQQQQQLILQQQCMSGPPPSQPPTTPLIPPSIPLPPPANAGMYLPIQFPMPHGMPPYHMPPPPAAAAATLTNGTFTPYLSPATPTYGLATTNPAGYEMTENCINGNDGGGNHTTRFLNYSTAPPPPIPVYMPTSSQPLHPHLNNMPININVCPPLPSQAHATTLLPPPPSPMQAPASQAHLANAFGCGPLPPQLKQVRFA